MEKAVEEKPNKEIVLERVDDFLEGILSVRRHVNNDVMKGVKRKILKYINGVERDPASLITLFEKLCDKCPRTWKRQGKRDLEGRFERLFESVKLVSLEDFSPEDIDYLLAKLGNFVDRIKTRGGGVEEIATQKLIKDLQSMSKRHFVQ